VAGEAGGLPGVARRGDRERLMVFEGLGPVAGQGGARYGRGDSRCVGVQLELATVVARRAVMPSDLEFYRSLVCVVYRC
jgi:hypothetical protein